MEEFLADLKPVAEWEWFLWQVTWSNSKDNRSLTMYCVETDTHIEAEVDRRWPSSYWTCVEWTPVSECKAPQSMWCSATRRKYHEDPWEAGKRLALASGLC